MAEGGAAEWQEQERLLSGVSRTFALTIPVLPPPLRRTVGTAYLLCRIADTIEDEPSLPVAKKRALSASFAEVVAGDADAASFAARLGASLSAATPGPEHALVAAAPRVVASARGFPPAHRAAIARCVTIMADGMSHFSERQDRAGLDDLAEMDRYCYAVAGVVGEMLTDLFCDHCPELGPQAPQMRLLAVRFGQGLQMTNILKDMWDDRRRGACWLPRTVFAAHGVDLRTVAAEAPPPGLASGVTELVAVAQSHLRAALDYTLLIPRRERGIRLFCLWAIAMALLTLRRIGAQPDFRDARDVKITRREVRAASLACRLAAGNDTLLRLLFRAVGRREADLPGAVPVMPPAQ